MKVLLRSSGKIQDVSDGYARNYLIPKGLAVEASGGVIKRLDEERKQRQERLEKEKSSLELVAKKLDGKKIIIRKKIGAGSKLFGSITGSNISELIKDRLGVVVDKKSIEIGSVIKSLGVFKIKINLGQGVTVSINIEVEEEK